MSWSYSPLKDEELPTKILEIKKRGKLKQYLCSTVGSIALILLMAINYEKDRPVKDSETFKSSVSAAYVLCIPSLAIMVFFRRLIIFLEEICHIKTRYDYQMSLVCRACFGDLVNLCVLIGIVVYIIAVYIFHNADIFEWIPMCFLMPIIVTCYEVILGHNNLVLNLAFQGTPSMGSIFAHAACTAYYLPVLEDIKERIEEFEKEFSISMSLNKLVLLVPLSCDVRGTLDKYENIEYISHLPPIVGDQGANMNRRYKNPVYKIFPESDNPIFLVIEEPSPILALRKMKASEIFQYHRHIFISILQEELEGSQCEILIYDDTECCETLPLATFLRQKLSSLKEKTDYRISIEN